MRQGHSKGLARRIEELKKQLVLAGLPGDKVMAALEQAERAIYGRSLQAVPTAITRYLGGLLADSSVESIELEINKTRDVISVITTDATKVFNPGNWSLPRGKKAKKAKKAKVSMLMTSRGRSKLEVKNRPCGCAKTGRHKKTCKLAKQSEPKLPQETADIVDEFANG